MNLSRRKMLALVGGGVVVAAGAGTSAFVATRRPDQALLPWELAGQYGEIRRDALSYALLAPNPHNLQPWQAELIGQDMVELRFDGVRRLPETDPFDRQLTIGMGCFLELMQMAAAQMGHATQTALYPEGEGGPVARIRFSRGEVAPDPLFAHVMQRRSHKENFAPGDVPPEHAAELAPHARIVTARDEVAALADLTTQAWLAEAATPAAWRESIDLLRIGKAEINATPDGIDLGGPMMEALRIAGLLSREAALDPDNPNARIAVQGTVDAIASAPAFVVQTSPGNTRRDQIAVGRDWLRLNLATTGLGLGLRPVSQALQEYPEMAAHHARAHALLARDDATVQMIGLLGYASPSVQTPRWPLEKKLLNA